MSSDQAGHDATNQGAPGEFYTGVVLIHGLGMEQRNDTLTEALDSITYWLNHEAGLQVRPNGPGRIWVETQLTDDSDPDAVASRATVTLQAPADPALSTEPEPLCLKLSEVWWAQSFGQPSVGTVLSWSILQFLQVYKRLAPFSRNPNDPRRIGHRDDQQNGSNPRGRFSSTRDADGDDPDTFLMKLLRGYLFFYDRLLYVVNICLWVAGVFVVFLLLVLAMLLNLISGVPGIPMLLRSLDGLFTLVSLHWLGSMQVYMEDYVWSTAMRERFQTQVEGYLNDPRCRSVVVIAHSMGTVIAYEGLVTALTQAEGLAAAKPVRFVCLAQALRRMWPVARTEPHRLRGALPSTVTWYDFWARFDPVPAGPLTPGALPQVNDWTDTYLAKDAYLMDESAEIKRQLADERMHIAVINRDNLLFDHTTYWLNLEQVVGPVTRILVDDNPALARYVERHLASRRQALLRRGRVAAQASAAWAAGVVVGAVILFSGTVWNWLTGTLVATLLSNLRSALGDTLSGWVSQLGQQIEQESHGVGVGATAARLLEFIWQYGARVSVAALAAGVTLFLLSMALPQTPYRFASPRARMRRPTSVRYASGGAKRTREKEAAGATRKGHGQP